MENCSSENRKKVTLLHSLPLNRKEITLNGVKKTYSETIIHMFFFSQRDSKKKGLDSNQSLFFFKPRSQKEKEEGNIEISFCLMAFGGFIDEDALSKLLATFPHRLFEVDSSYTNPHNPFSRGIVIERCIDDFARPELICNCSDHRYRVEDRIPKPYETPYFYSVCKRYDNDTDDSDTDE
jgi:hypothetical protein